MSRLLRSAATIVVSIAAASASGQDAAVAAHDGGIMGEWRGAMGQSSPTSQLALSMFRDGSYVRRVVTVTEFAWTSEPHLLNFAEVTRKGNDLQYGRAMAVRMTVNAISLTTIYGNDSIVLYRLGGTTSDSSVIGRWQGENANGEEVIEEFAPDGQLLVMVTVARDLGHYSLVAKDEIEWLQQVPTEGKHRDKFKLQGNKLKLFVEPGPNEDFRGYPYPTRKTVELFRGPIQPR